MGKGRDAPKGKRQRSCFDTVSDLRHASTGINGILQACETGLASAGQTAVQIEPDLRLLVGLMTVLRYLGERTSSDPVDPAAIAALVIPAEEALDRLVRIQRSVAPL